MCSIVFVPEKKKVKVVRATTNIFKADGHICVYDPKTKFLSCSCVEFLATGFCSIAIESKKILESDGFKVKNFLKKSFNFLEEINFFKKRLFEVLNESGIKRKTSKS